MIERSNRTIVSRGRIILLAASGLFKALWGEAIVTSIYLTNRSPTKVLSKGKIPHEMLYGTVSRYRYIKTFGYAAYALKPHIKDESKLATIRKAMAIKIRSYHHIQVMESS